MACRRADNRNSYYINEELSKERIVLHFTAGHLQGDLITMMNPDSTISVPYVIGRNGTVYQLFNPKYWAWHLGRNAIGSNSIQSPHTIAIEVSNYGYLKKIGDELHTYHSTPSTPDVYCHIEDRNVYTELETEFRGKNYFANYTDSQYESLVILLRYLTNRFNIERSFLPWNSRFDTTEDVLAFSGIVSHINYRNSGKWDIGPAFDWNRVEQGLAKQLPVPLPNPTTKGTRNYDHDMNLYSDSDIDTKYKLSELTSEKEHAKHDGDGPNH